jgi:hypothetical protein
MILQCTDCIADSYESPVEFRPGDTLQIKCVYNSEGQSDITRYGDGMSEEMCYGFFTYYPISDSFHTCVAYGTGPYCPTYESELDEIVGDCNATLWGDTRLPGITEELLGACEMLRCKDGCIEVVQKARQDLCLLDWVAVITEPLVSSYGSPDQKKAMQLLHSCDREIYLSDASNETPKDEDRYEEKEGMQCPFTGEGTTEPGGGGAAAIGVNALVITAIITSLNLFLVCFQ